MDRMEAKWLSKPRGAFWAMLRRVARRLSRQRREESGPPRKIYTYTVNCGD